MARVIAVTGGIGAGKSSVCKILQARGYAVLDADACAHEALLNPIVVEQVKLIFGEDCYLPSGGLNREFVREAIFRDASLRTRMEQIVHPQVRRLSAERARAAAATSKDGWVFYEFALLFETQRQSDFDAVLLVTANEAARISRVASSRSLLPEQVKSIVAAQTTDTVRLAGAHVVIDNSGDVGQLELAVTEALTALAAKFAELNF